MLRQHNHVVDLGYTGAKVEGTLVSAGYNYLGGIILVLDDHGATRKVVATPGTSLVSSLDYHMRVDAVAQAGDHIQIERTGSYSEYPSYGDLQPGVAAARCKVTPSWVVKVTPSGPPPAQITPLLGTVIVRPVPESFGLRKPTALSIQSALQWFVTQDRVPGPIAYGEIADAAHVSTTTLIKALDMGIAETVGVGRVRARRSSQSYPIQVTRWILTDDSLTLTNPAVCAPIWWDHPSLLSRYVWEFLDADGVASISEIGAALDTTLQTVRNACKSLVATEAISRWGTRCEVVDGWDPWEQTPETVTVMVESETGPVEFTGTRVECSKAKREAAVAHFKSNRDALWGAAKERHDAQAEADKQDGK